VLTIRRYEPPDAGPTLEVFRAAVRVTARADYSEEQTRAWASRGERPGWHERRAATETWVAEADDVVVGFADRDDAGFIGMLFVHPTAGGRGVARALIERLVESAQAAALSTLRTHASLTARPAFERLEFAPDPTGNSTDIDAGTHDPSGAQAVLIGNVAFTNYRLLRRLRPLP